MLEEIRYTTLNKIEVTKLVHAFESYREFLRPQKLIATADDNIGHSLLVDPLCEPNMSEGAICMVWQIRMNKLGVANDEKAWNDYMITVENPSDLNGLEEPRLEVFKGTLDPKTLRNGMFFSIPHMTYRHTGKHHGLSWRDCLRQDNIYVLHPGTGQYIDYRTWGIRFYKVNGKWIDMFEHCKYAFGHKTIHSHGPGKYSFANTGLGCFMIGRTTVFARDFRPMLRRANAIGQGKIVPIAYITAEMFMQLIDHVQAIKGQAHFGIFPRTAQKELERQLYKAILSQ